MSKIGKPPEKRIVGDGTASQSKPPASTEQGGLPSAERTSDYEVADFIAKMKSVGPLHAGARGRLIFAMDATMSRAPTWDMALAHQAEMFEAVRAVGGLDVQLVYFRGSGECRASRWVSDPAALARLMTTVSCQGGKTQIGKVLGHARSEASHQKVSAMVYVGDCVEEDVDLLCAKSGELKLVGIPVFLFQEGRDANASVAFAEIARITGGAHCRFDQGAGTQLRDLLTAVAVYAAGGRHALEALTDRRGGEGAAKLLAALPAPRMPPRGRG